MSQRPEARREKREARREARAARQQTKRGSRTPLPLPVLGAGAALLVAAAIGWFVLRPGTEAAPGSGGLPGPLGGPSVSTDVNTLVGKPASTFTLLDSDGNNYTVTPGQGKPIVLVTHMGIT